MSNSSCENTRLNLIFILDRHIESILRKNLYSAIEKLNLMFVKRKGQKELQMIISLIILLVVAVVIISLFLQVFGQKPGVGKKQVEKQKIITQCNSMCQNIRDSTEQGRDATLRAIYNYCKESFHFNPNSGQGSLIEGIYVPAAGANAFCIDKARCFNFQEGSCKASGVTINAQTCLRAMCNYLNGPEMTMKEVNDAIENEMSKGQCELEKNPDKGLYKTPWWEKHFKEVDCSQVVSGDENTNTGATCEGVCSDDWTPAEEGSCITRNKCLNEIGSFAQSEVVEEDKCEGDKVCCCTPPMS